MNESNPYVKARREWNDRYLELARVLRSYIPYYNGVRLHSEIGYSSPIDYEARAT